MVLTTDRSCAKDSPIRPRLTFQAQDRIQESAHFQRAFDRKRSVSNEILIVYGVENQLPNARLGISVGKRKMRKAHDRNHAKRLLREAFRTNKPQLPTGIDYVIVPRGQAFTFQQASETLPGLCQAAARKLGMGRAHHHQSRQP